MRNLRFVGIADDPGDARECNKFLRGALGVASGDDDAGGGILRMDFSNGGAGLRIGGGGHGASIYDNDAGGGGIGCGGKAAVEQLAFDGGAIGLRGAAAELLDVESGQENTGRDKGIGTKTATNCRVRQMARIMPGAADRKMQRLL